jgi:hypothetical protein
MQVSSEAKVLKRADPVKLELVQHLKSLEAQLIASSSWERACKLVQIELDQLSEPVFKDNYCTAKQCEL